MPIPAVVVGTTIDPTTFGNAVVDELNHRGLKAIGTKSAPQTGITAVVDVSSLTVTWTADAGRRYKISWMVGVYSSVANDSAIFTLTDAANAQVQNFSKLNLSATFGDDCSGFIVESGLSGSITRKVRVARLSGSGGIIINAGAGKPNQLIVEDIGPV